MKSIVFFMLKALRMRMSRNEINLHSRDLSQFL